MYYILDGGALENLHLLKGYPPKKSEIKSNPHCLSEWNGLDLEIRLTPSVGVFKRKLLSIIRPPVNSTFGIHDPTGISYLTQLRVGLSKLYFHKFKYNFRDTLNPMCHTNDGIEDTEHFLLLCPSFVEPRRNHLAGVFAVLRPPGYTNLHNRFLMQILLYGCKSFPNETNSILILLLTSQFIHKSGRFDWNSFSSTLNYITTTTMHLFMYILFCLFFLSPSFKSCM